ncbi:MAG: hypothetical protein KY432_02080, partial [Acidobacteria bacterium]|nr:hypothetical protein [Acidobacteriota bacterium]
MFESTVVESRKKATDKLSAQDPATEEEMTALLAIDDLNKKLAKASRELDRTKTDAAQAAFEAAAQELKLKLELYAATFK